MRRGALAVALALVAVVVMAGRAAGAQIAPARVRVVQAVPDAPALDVLLNSRAEFCQLHFKAVTRYTTVPVGTYNLQAALPNGGQTLLNSLLKVEPNTPYSVVLLGTRGKVEALTLIDDLSAPPAGMSRVRFVHAAPGAPAVDIAIKGGPVLFHNVGFKGVGAYVSLSAGTYDVEVRLASTGQVIAEVPGVTVGDGVVYTVYAVGLPTGNPPLQPLVAVESVAGRAVPAQP